MIHRNRFRAAALLLATALAACADGAPTGAAPESAEATLARQVAALGFRRDMIQDHGSFVLVEGDIYLSKEQLRTVTLADGDDPLRPDFQYHTTNLVTSANVRDIVVNLSGLSSQTAWQTAARDAMTHWNGTGSNVVMTEGATAVDITVATTCTSSNVAAFASFPSGGNTGPTIYVNTCFGYSTSSSQKLHNMVHEFGHTLGFRHSNYTQMGESAGTEGAVHISGTPTSGNATGSVMNGGTALNSWAGFAASDLTAVRSIYPLPPPTGLTVTNSGGNPLISWSAVTGATGYTVAYRESRTIIQKSTFDTSTEQDESVLGSTSATSFLDTSHPYTGSTFCRSFGTYTSVMTSYSYVVTASFPGGAKTSASVGAPVGWC